MLLTVHPKRFPQTDGKNRLRPVKNENRYENCRGSGCLAEDDNYVH